ncbi:MAG: DUF3883 domain-containing protein [Burkholderiales bacterium]
MDDDLSMLASELADVSFNKAAHRHDLKARLANRSDASIEFKHANISAALLDAGFPYINGYKPRSNYQSLLAQIVAEKLSSNPSLLDIAAFDADRPMVIPEVDDILAVLIARNPISSSLPKAGEPPLPTTRMATNYIEREARNRSLGNAGETFVLNYERARLIHAGRDALASKIEHTSKVRGDHAGFDILSFEDDGRERLIEVKTTEYGSETPFFVTRNEIATSEKNAPQYQLYRLFSFRDAPLMYALSGSIPISCQVSAATFLALPK